MAEANNGTLGVKYLLHPRNRFVKVNNDKFYIYSTFVLAGTALHLPSRWFALTINKSLNICNEAETTLSLLPGTSCQSTGTSATGIPSCLAKSRSSTSNIQVGRCWKGKSCCAAEREKSLKPHWVSRIYPTPKMRRIVWNPYIRIFLSSDRWFGVCECDSRRGRSQRTFTTASELTRCARLPTTTPGASPDAISSIASQSCSKSSILLAPSASAMSNRLPPE